MRQNIKIRMGFDNDSIVIFRGNTFPIKDELKAAGAKYNPLWGWWFKTMDDVPILPDGIDPLILDWKSVALSESEMKSEEEIKATVDTLLFPESDWVGDFVADIGDRVSVYLNVDRVVTLQNSGAQMFVMYDDLGNMYVWTTGTYPDMEAGKTYNIRGTMKDKRVYKGQRQNVLTRCKIL